jgi:predicted nucleic acid-binding Zn ribbon protein
MASIITPANVTIDLVADGALVAATSMHECAYCLSPIGPGQQWVREKIYEPLNADRPRYRRYHADLFGDQELSCWEKHEMELENARTARTAVHIM